MEMPILKPIPIKTKGLSYLKAHKVLFASIRTWEVVQDWHYDLCGETIIVPKGFVFDGASIPKIFRNILSPVGILLIPGLLHDYGYKYNKLIGVDVDGKRYEVGAGIGQKGFDAVFYDIGVKVNGLADINYTAWFLLRMFGFMAWNKHRKAEKAK